MRGEKVKAIGLRLVRWSWFVSGSYFLFTGEAVAGVLFFVVAFLQRIAEGVEAGSKPDVGLQEKYNKLSIAHRYLQDDLEKLKTDYESLQEGTALNMMLEKEEG